MSGCIKLGEIRRFDPALFSVAHLPVWLANATMAQVIDSHAKRISSIYLYMPTNSRQSIYRPFLLFVAPPDAGAAATGATALALSDTPASLPASLFRRTRS